MTESIDSGVTSPGPSGPTAAERLAALRNKPAEKRRKPAHTSKILISGLSTTALFGMVAAMGWPTARETAQSAQLQTTAFAPTVPVATSTTVSPTTVPATASTVETVPTPTTVPTTTAAIVVPMATPVVQPPVRNASVRTASNTVTKTSG